MEPERDFLGWRDKVDKTVWNLYDGMLDDREHE
jgi:hypothetical protein